MDDIDDNNISLSQISYGFISILLGFSAVFIGAKAFDMTRNDIRDRHEVARNIEWLNNYKNTSTKQTNLAGTNKSNVATAYSLLADNSASATSTDVVLNNESTTNKPILTIMIGGDVMMDRGIRKLGKEYGYDSLFQNLAPLFKQADIVTVNMEGPITSYPSKTLLPNNKTSKELTFTFDPKTVTALKNAGITSVDLANNHSDNFGQIGLNETKKWLTNANIKWFGDPKNSTSSETIITKNGISVAFIGYNAFQRGFDRVLVMVEQAKSKSDFVIVMPHWGEEYSTTSSALMRSQARLLVASGAGAIFGTHPHVVLEHTLMGDVPVFYSLGNLLFDQYFQPEVTKGNLVELGLNRKSDNSVYIDNIRIYNTSTATRRGVTVESEPIDFSQ